MANSNRDFTAEVNSFIRDYTDMDIFGIKIHSPYWMNRLKAGKVVIRGFQNGKGSAGEIKSELSNRIKNNPGYIDIIKSREAISKFARREKIGIDCSGFVYRVLEKIISLEIGNSKISDLSELFPGGINRTDSKTLTSTGYAKPITRIKDLKIGDMIRIDGGKHVAVISGIYGKMITYTHSSFLKSAISGVHSSTIKIVNGEKWLDEQFWSEITRTGENFGKKYFNPYKGDGVFRLKIFS